MGGVVRMVACVMVGMVLSYLVWCSGGWFLFCCVVFCDVVEIMGCNLIVMP